MDGGFFLKRYRVIHASEWKEQTARDVAQIFHQTTLKHLRDQNGARNRELYRIFYYDCPPLTKKLHYPISKQAFDASKSREAQFRLDFFDELRKCRKVALRLGRLSDHFGWRLKMEPQKALLSGKLQVADLTDDDFEIETHQKGVDMRIGVDIASLAFKRQVDQIVLVAGDGDFVPAAKLARREGIDFVLDPMWAAIPNDLHEHIDGLKSVWQSRSLARPPRNRPPRSYPMGFPNLSRQSARYGLLYTTSPGAEMSYPPRLAAFSAKAPRPWRRRYLPTAPRSRPRWLGRRPAAPGRLFRVGPRHHR